MSSQENHRLGWIGLGSMGLAMAVNLQKHLKASNKTSLEYWNRTIEKGDPVKQEYGQPSPSIEQLVQDCNIIFISVSDDTALQTIISTILSSTHPLTSKTFIDTTTVHPSTSSSITSQLTSSGATYIAAPVFGATPLAQSGQLLIALAGPSKTLTLISPYLKGVLARGVIIVGPEPSQALLLKTTSNYITAGLMFLLSEAHTLASVSGLPESALESLIEQNFGAYAHGVSKRLTTGAYYPESGMAPGSGLELGIKDVGHGVSLARAHGMRAEIGEMYLAAAKEAKAYGDERGRRCDSSSVFGMVRRRAGLEFETQAVRERDAELKEN